MDLEQIFEIAQNRGAVGPGSFLSNLEHSRAFDRLIPEDDRRLLDIGSGGGLPGLVLAAEDDREWTLLDSMQKRVDFLTMAVDELGLESRVSVVHARAESAARDESLRETFEVVTARSFGPPAVTAECAVGFLNVGGYLIVAEPPEGSRRWDDDGLRKLGMAIERSVDSPNMVRIVKVESFNEWPRREGLPSKSPLW